MAEVNKFIHLLNACYSYYFLLSFLFFLIQIFGVGIAVTSVLTLLTPLAANAGVNTLVFVRVVEGFFEVQ